MNRKRILNFVFVLFCTMSFFSAGTAMMDYFLVYPSRFIVGENEFVAYHKLLEKAIWPISVGPFLLIIVLNVLLVFKTPQHVSRNLLKVSLVLLLLDFLSTVLLQAPWNYELANGKNVELMQKISDTNWFRVFLEVTHVIVVFKVLVSKINVTSEALES
jgi:hypothetical protein